MICSAEVVGRSWYEGEASRDVVDAAEEENGLRREEVDAEGEGVGG